ncbi:MAG: ArsR/SmtB family transcription factor [Gemmatimonadaceae bacterium]
MLQTPAAEARPRADLGSAAALFHALSDETRLAILEMLQDVEWCVCDLQGALGAAQSRLSFHLKVLKDAGLVVDRKEGRWSYYAVVPERLAEAGAYIAGLAGSHDSRKRARVRLPLARLSDSALAEPLARAKARRGLKGDSCCG